MAARTSFPGAKQLGRHEPTRLADPLSGNPVHKGLQIGIPIENSSHESIFRLKKDSVGNIKLYNLGDSRLLIAVLHMFS